MKDQIINRMEEDMQLLGLSRRTQKKLRLKRTDWYLEKNINHPYNLTLKLQVL